MGIEIGFIFWGGGRQFAVVGLYKGNPEIQTGMPVSGCHLPAVMAVNWL